jgi:hypothetical protein
MKTRVRPRRADYSIASELHTIRPSLEAEFENHWKKRALFGASSTVYRDCGTGAEIADNLVTPVAEIPETAPVAGQESGETTRPEAVMAENTEPAVATTVAPQPPDVASSEPASKKKATRAKKAPVAATTKAAGLPWEGSRPPGFHFPRIFAQHGIRRTLPIKTAMQIHENINKHPAYVPTTNVYGTPKQAKLTCVFAPLWKGTFHPVFGTLSRHRTTALIESPS